MFYVYILQSIQRDKYYIGSTRNLEERLSRHNRGDTKSLKPYIPMQIVYTEVYETRQEAYRREKKIKSYKGGISFKKLLK